VLIITIIAAVVTPTTDIMNMMVFEVPMLLLYLLGVFFAWLVVRHREKKEKDK
jgi:sec-independent protein translocase protein TatC